MVLAYTFMQILGLANSFLNKRFQQSLENKFSVFIFYNLINAFFATILFFFMCKFNVLTNLRTLIYAFIYAIIVIGSLCLTILVLSKISVSLFGVINSSSGILASVAFGLLLFGETFKWQMLFAVIFMIAAVVIPYLKIRQLDFNRKSIFICIIQFACIFISTPFIKFYLQDSKVDSAQIMFFWTNLFAVIICLIMMLFFMKFSKEKVDLVHIFNFRNYANIVLRTVNSNVSSVLAAYVLARMDITLYTLLGAGIGYIMGIIMSKFIFKETLYKENYIAVCCASIATVFSVL